MQEIDEQELLLPGLDGSNPLAFLATVGALRVATQFDWQSDWSLTWKIRHGKWTPVLCSSRTLSKQMLVKLLCEALHKESTLEFDFAKNLNISPTDFKKVAERAQFHASPRERRYADFVSSFGCELITTSDGKSIQDTAMRTMSGAGHQHFLGTIKQLVTHTKADHLHRALFDAWDYADDKLGLRWDPEEDRRYALRWKNPSGDIIRTMRGANRLAVEALPLLPTAPFGRRLNTTGFATRERAILFSWPIWNGNLSLNVVRSLLASPEIQEREADRVRLNATGVVEIYRSQRITVGKYRNFTRSQPA